MNKRFKEEKEINLKKLETRKKEQLELREQIREERREEARRRREEEIREAILEEERLKNMTWEERDEYLARKEAERISWCGTFQLGSKKYAFNEKTGAIVDLYEKDSYYPEKIYRPTLKSGSLDLEERK